MPIDFDAVYLSRRPANHMPLTPLHFLARAAEVFPDKTAIIHGERRDTWAEHARRCHKLASALRRAGIGRGHVVSILCQNTPAMLEAHFGVPMAGAVLNTINTRLDPAGVAFILEHCEASVFLVDTQLGATAREALALMAKRPLVLDIEDVTADAPVRVSDRTYEDFLAGGDETEPAAWPADEFDAISLNYTSGTTGSPKGAVYHHRGTYLNALGQLLHHGMSSTSVYLWTLPLFHCNGWCFSWAVAAVGGTHVCLRKVAADPIFDAIEAYGVTHMCCAPTVLSFVADAAARHKRGLPHSVAVMTAGSAPPAAILKRSEEIGFRIRHVYGSTEIHGVTSLCDWHEEWDRLPAPERSQVMARQGVRTVTCEDMMVADPVTMAPVPRDAATMGEVMFRTNLGMKGYLKNPGATDEAFAHGWYHTGDLAVVHGDGYIELKDRSKDIIISGGENISSIEVEDVLYQHGAVSCAAVVAMNDDKWGEVPCAFVELSETADCVTETEIIEFCRDRLAKYKLPRRVVFGPIERTATGKIQKFKLRQQLNQS
ncbi:AMP-binding protein [Methylobacterium frigidaeris]|uniref:3-methylmercaptopropionyl-CoA ligase n=1 Tax=Methylobacterium frigidaeris TaxID=2038277 RepID=A0AA37HIA7_9HYPH|nr:AMP-binding protein [Methylobacterium frigidaeris]GJD66051.1 Long-chain-fatty-acid--CoA ligase [Methylobacterium frigidaeris]